MILTVNEGDQFIGRACGTMKNQKVFDFVSFFQMIEEAKPTSLSRHLVYTQQIMKTTGSQTNKS